MTLPDFGHRAELLTCNLINEIHKIGIEETNSKLIEALKKIKYSHKFYLVLLNYVRQMVGLYNELNHSRDDGHPHM